MFSDCNRARLFNQPGTSEREIAFARDNDVIQQPDVEQCRCSGDPVGKDFVFGTRFRRARRMVVNQNQLRGEQFQTPV